MNKNLFNMLRKLLTRETLMYLIFGVLTTIISIAAFYLISFFKLHVAVTNFYSTMIAVLFAFITNKFWVFESKSVAPRVILPELLKFSSGRAVMYFAETFLLMALTSYLGLGKMLAKIITTAIVVIANYLISKKTVFNVISWK